MSFLPISKIEIDDFRFERHLAIPITKDYNFLIGENGKGKTTLINIVAAALEGNLDRLFFDRFVALKISFGDESRNESWAHLEITKEFDSDVEEVQLRCELSGSKPEFRFSNSFNYTDLRGPNFRGTSRMKKSGGSYVTYNAFLTHDPSNKSPVQDFSDKIRAIIPVRTITVHRAPIEAEESGKPQSGVDRKLAQQRKHAAAILSRMDRADANLVSEFQVEIFLSMIDSSSDEFNSEEISTVNFDHEYAQLTEIFSSLKVPAFKYSSRLKDHIEAAKLIAARQNNSDSMSQNQIAGIVRALRMHKLVEKWSEVQAKRDSIYKGKNLFLQTAQGLFSDKEIYFDGSNDIRIRKKGQIFYSDNESDNDLNILDLASGEKQLLIFLLDALLQDEKICFFIVDEPEISLRIRWQAALAESVKTINPNCQIFFATHSPDIVGNHRDGVFSL